MEQAKKFYLLPFYFFVLGALFSCAPFFQSGLNGINFRLGIYVTNIRDLKPQQDNNVMVYLQGKVAKQIPLLERQVYQLQDSTGTIWVLTNQTSIQQGDEVLVKGKVRYESIPLAGKDFGELYIEEQEQLERIPVQG